MAARDPRGAVNSGPLWLRSRLRDEASVTGHCACGAVAQDFEIMGDGSLRSTSSFVAGHVYLRKIEHEEDCPAISEAL